MPQLDNRTVPAEVLDAFRRLRDGDYEPDEKRDLRLTVWRWSGAPNPHPWEWNPVDVDANDPVSERGPEEHKWARAVAQREAIERALAEQGWHP